VGFAQACHRSGAPPLHAVLLEHCDVADAEDDLRTTPAHLIQRRRELRDVGRIAHVDRRDAGPEPDPLRPIGQSAEQYPRVLVVDLIRAVARVIAEFVREHRRSGEFFHRLLRDQLEAYAHLQGAYR
jgi:hypothetical protein